MSYVLQGVGGSTYVCRRDCKGEAYRDNGLDLTAEVIYKDGQVALMY